MLMPFMKTRLFPALFMLTGTFAMAAGTATIIRPDKLREQPASSSWSVMELHRRTTVRVLETRRDWVRVEADGNRSGWVHEQSLSMDAQEQDRSASPARSSNTAPLARTAPRASNHALILTLGNPSSSRQDGSNATAIAHLMGVPDANIRQPGPDALSLDGLRQALVDLDARMGDKDRAFIYLSGDSSRQVEDGHCSTAVVLPAAQGVIGSKELAAHLRTLARRADKLFILIDTRPGGTDCPAPEDGIARSLNDSKGRAGTNVLYFATTQKTTDGQGGLVTRALLACLDGQAALSAAAGMPNGRELRDCAQATLTTHAGKAGTVASIALAGNAALIPAPVMPAGGARSPHALLSGLHAQRDDSRQLSVTGLRTNYRSSEPIRFTVASGQPGYLQVLAAADDGFTLLFPNQTDPVGRIDRNATISLPPRDKDSSSASGALRSTSSLLFIVTDSPRNFFRAGFSRSGAFATVPADARTLRDLPLEILGGDNSPTCTRSETRNLGPSQLLLCSTSFGAALHEITEMP
jgi:hypothetical protein